jgi:hypothetical protein
MDWIGLHGLKTYLNTDFYTLIKNYWIQKIGEYVVFIGEEIHWFSLNILYSQ